MKAIDPEILNNVIRQRRTVKAEKFKPGSSVPDDIIHQALYNATWAPNHGKTEPWHFIVFTGEGLKKLNQFQADLYKQESGDKFTEAKYNNMRDQYKNVSHSIAICHKRNPASKIPVIEEIQAVAVAVQNMALTIFASGYAGMWSTGGVTYYEKAKPYFGLGEDDKLLGFFLVGEFSEDQPDSVRKPVSEKSTWISSE